MKDKLADFDNYYNEKFSEMQTEIEAVKKIAKDGV